MPFEIIRNDIVKMKMDTGLFDEKAYQLSGKIFMEVQSYIDAHYVEERLDEEYAANESEDILEKSFYRDDEPSLPYAGNYVPKPREQKLSQSIFRKERHFLSTCVPESLEVMLKQEEMSFSKALRDWIIRKDLKNPDVYKKVDIDRRLFGKIMNNPDYHPDKSTAIALALALELNLEETKEFIGRAGYALTYSSKYDIIIEYFLKKRIYDMEKIDEILELYGYRAIRSVK